MSDINSTSTPESEIQQSDPLTDPLPTPQIQTRDKPVRQKNKMSSWMLFNVVAPLGLLAAGIAFVLVMGEASAPPREAEDTSLAGRMKALSAVRVAKIQSLESTGQKLELVVDGNVVPFRESRVAAEVAGKIVFKAENCEAGNVVKKGQVLMRIDQDDYKLQVEQFSRQKQQAYQSLREVDQQLVNAQRLIDVAKKDVALQEKEVKRQESLPSNFASRREIDQAKRSLLQAEQQLVNNENQYDLLKKSRVRLEASEQLAATQLQTAELNLKRTEIVAPIDGVIVREDADLNTFVNRGTVLVTIEDTSKVEVATSLRMDQLYWVLDQADQSGNSSSDNSSYELPETSAIIEYELTGREGQTYRWNGRLLSYDGLGLNPQTRTVPVRVLVDNPKQYIDAKGNPGQANGPSALLRGMYVRVKLQVEPRTPLVVIPGTALQPGNRVWQFVKDDSVLDAEPSKESEPESTEEPKTTDVADDATEESDEPVFNAEDWSAGRVVAQNSVVPVDSLRFKDDEGSTTERRFWVCEASSDALGHDSYVVVSPIGAVDEKGLPARANLTEEPGNLSARQKPDALKAETDAKSGSASGEAA